MSTSFVPDSPAVRASDAEREQHARLLQAHAGEGRIGFDELSERLDGVYAARTRAELAALVRDLPPLAPARAPDRTPAPVARKRQEFRGHLAAYVMVNVLLVAVWAMTGADYFWPMWPLLGWGIGLASHAGEAFLGRPAWSGACGRPRVSGGCGQRRLAGERVRAE